MSVAPSVSVTTRRIRSRSSSISATVSRWSREPSASNTAGCGIWRYVLPVVGPRHVSMRPSVATTTFASRNRASAAASAATPRAVESAASSGMDRAVVAERVDPAAVDRPVRLAAPLRPAAGEALQLLADRRGRVVQAARVHPAGDPDLAHHRGELRTRSSCRSSRPWSRADERLRRGPDQQFPIGPRVQVVESPLAEAARELEHQSQDSALSPKSICSTACRSTGAAP